MADMMWTNGQLAERIEDGEYNNLSLDQWVEMFKKLEVAGAEPSTAREAKRRIVKHLDELVDNGNGNRASKWQKPSARIEDVVAIVNGQRLAIEEQLSDMRELTGEQLEQMRAQTVAMDPAKLEEAMRKIYQEELTKSVSSPEPPASETDPEPDPDKDLSKWLEWAERQPAGKVPQALINATKDALKTPTKKDDKNVVRRIIDWGNKPAFGRKNKEEKH